MSDQPNPSTIGIIGSGNIGSAFAGALARAGIGAIISNSRRPESLAPLLAEIGGTVRAGTREDAATQDIVLVAVPWSKLPAALAGLPEFGGRIVIDANNAVDVVVDPNNPTGAPQFVNADLQGRTSSEIVASLAPGARVVKAFNHLPAPLVAGDPHSEGGRRVLFYAGDDAPAKTQVGALIERLGFFGIDLGSLSVGGGLFQFPGGPLPLHNLANFS